MPDTVSTPWVPTTPDPPVAELYAWLESQRTHRPVHYDEDTGAWHVFTYQEAQQVFTEPLLSSDMRKAGRAVGLDMSQLPVIERLNEANFFQADRATHQRYRALVNRTFTRRLVADLAPRVAAVVDGLLDGLHGADGFDLLAEFAYPGPLQFLCELLGIPVADRPGLQVWSDVLTDPGEVAARQGRPVQDVVDEHMLEFESWLLDYARRRRARPEDDLASRLVAAEVGGSGLSDSEVASLIAMIILAGHNTTSMLLANFVLCMDEHPEAAAELRTDRSALPTAIDEVLRYRTLLPRTLRVTTAETRIGEHAIPADQAVVVWSASANRDSRQFPNPDTFDLRRSPNRHLTFGHGIHLCLGMHMARTTSRIAISSLLDRCPEITVRRDEPLDYPKPRINLCPKRLPITVQWNPAP